MMDVPALGTSTRNSAKGPAKALLKAILGTGAGSTPRGPPGGFESNRMPFMCVFVRAGLGAYVGNYMGKLLLGEQPNNPNIRPPRT